MTQEKLLPRLQRHLHIGGFEVNLSEKEWAILRNIYFEAFHLSDFSIEDLCSMEKERIMKLIDLLSENISYDCTIDDIRCEGNMADDLISFLTNILVERNEF